MDELLNAAHFFGSCKFCGQAALNTDCGDCLTQEEADERATENCNCLQAEKKRASDRTYINATAVIDDLFDAEIIKTRGLPEIKSDIIGLTKKLARMIADEAIEKASIIINERNSISLVYVGSEKIKITLTDKRKINAM